MVDVWLISKNNGSYGIGQKTVKYSSFTSPCLAWSPLLCQTHRCVLTHSWQAATQNGECATVGINMGSRKRVFAYCGGYTEILRNLRGGNVPVSKSTEEMDGHA